MLKDVEVHLGSYVEILKNRVPAAAMMQVRCCTIDVVASHRVDVARHGPDEDWRAGSGTISRFLSANDGELPTGSDCR